MQQQFDAPQGSVRLFDLIKCNDIKYAEAFYFGVRDTLVCEDLDQAQKIAYGQRRFRVVSLKGDMIETSGTMSGGGKPKKGGMSSQIIQEFNEE